MLYPPICVNLSFIIELGWVDMRIWDTGSTCQSLLICRQPNIIFFFLHPLMQLHQTSLFSEIWFHSTWSLNPNPLMQDIQYNIYLATKCILSYFLVGLCSQVASPFFEVKLRRGSNWSPPDFIPQCRQAGGWKGRSPPCYNRVTPWSRKGLRLHY